MPVVCHSGDCLVSLAGGIARCDERRLDRCCGKAMGPESAARFGPRPEERHPTPILSLLACDVFTSPTAFHRATSDRPTPVQDRQRDDS
jgi:hypothetical protein